MQGYSGKAGDRMEVSSRELAWSHLVDPRHDAHPGAQMPMPASREHIKSGLLYLPSTIVPLPSRPSISVLDAFVNSIFPQNLTSRRQLLHSSFSKTINGTGTGRRALELTHHDRLRIQRHPVIPQNIEASMTSLPLLTPGRGLMLIANLIYTGG